MVRLGLGRRGGSGRRRGAALWCSSFACRLDLFGLALAFSLVGFNLGLDFLLGFNIVEFLLAFAGGFLDLLFALQLLLGIVRFLCRLLANLL